MFPLVSNIDRKKVIHISRIFHSGAHIWAHRRPSNGTTGSGAVSLDASWIPLPPENFLSKMIRRFVTYALLSVSGKLPGETTFKVSSQPLQVQSHRDERILFWWCLIFGDFFRFFPLKVFLKKCPPNFSGSYKNRGRIKRRKLRTQDWRLPSLKGPPLRSGVRHSNQKQP
jgi:hypothetical protein